ncbi:hypothetical protein ATCC90586_001127 [Pythium insidiosum]|nr:hypothetical protein ATCC90586_001127 [Pythium insidiosum]
MSDVSAQKIIIVCLEGCHGCGKTSLSDEFEARGYRVLDEAFMDMPSYALPPQSLLMETSWVCSWFERVLRLARKVRHDKSMTPRPHVYIADRSPFSAVFYAQHGRLLEPVIREQMREVEQFSNVQFYTVNLSVEPELLWTRILERLEREPERVRFNEHKRSWMDQTLAFYDTFNWDLTVQNGADSISSVADNIVEVLCDRDPAFRLAHTMRKTERSLMDTSYASTDSDEEVPEIDDDSLSYKSNNSSVMSPVAKSPSLMKEEETLSIISFNNCSFDF